MHSLGEYWRSWDPVVSQTLSLLYGIFVPSRHEGGEGAGSVLRLEVLIGLFTCGT